MRYPVSRSGGSLPAPSTPETNAETVPHLSQQSDWVEVGKRQYLPGKFWKVGKIRLWPTSGNLATFDVGTDDTAACQNRTQRRVVSERCDTWLRGVMIFLICARTLNQDSTSRNVLLEPRSSVVQEQDHSMVVVERERPGGWGAPVRNKKRPIARAETKGSLPGF